MKHNQTIVIFEGPDRCGKSQIAKELSRRTGISYFKASSEHSTYLGDKKDLFLKQLLHADPRMIDLLRQTKLSLIMDRAYPSEYVYSKVMNRPTDHDMLNIVDQEYASLGAVIVICYRETYKGIVDDIDPKINESVLDRLQAEYIEFAKTTKCDVMFLNVSDENLDREVNQILDFIVHRKPSAIENTEKLLSDVEKVKRLFPERKINLAVTDDSENIIATIDYDEFNRDVNQLLAIATG